MISLSSLFKKSPAESVFRDLKVDMHSHLIPGIDDGSPDVATSLTHLKGLHALGYEKIITTPHVMSDLYRNDSATIREGLRAVNAEVKQAGLKISVEAAAEYFVDKHFEQLIENNDILSFGSKRYVLIEMSFVSVSQNIEEVVFTLASRGYQPILAHPERYAYLANRPSFYERLVGQGAMTQVNILSLLGYYGKGVQNWALALLKAGFVHFLGTDLHHNQHLDLLSRHQYDRKLADIIASHPFRNKELLH
jgi:protein-tyrosine phosphatase